MLAELRERARANRRSLNSEVLDRLEQSLERRPIDPEAFLERVQKLLGRDKLPPLTAEALRKAKEWGRP